MREGGRGEGGQCSVLQYITHSAIEWCTLEMSSDRGPVRGKKKR